MGDGDEILQKCTSRCNTLLQLHVRNVALERQLKELGSKYENVLEENQKLARTDKMTGLANKDRMYREIEHHLGIHQRDTRVNNFAVIFADIDNFKKVNDEDHLIGDHLIIEFADFLQAESRPGDLVARFGGDEFVILAPSTTKREADEICKRIQQGLKSYRFAGAKIPPVHLMASMGSASTSEGLISLEELVHIADQRMKEEKFEKRRLKTEGE